MIRSRVLDVLPVLGMLLLGSCVAPPRVAPAPPPPAPPPTVVALPPPATRDWTDGPLTPGGWRYAAAPDGGTLAAFGAAGAPPLFTLRCDPGARQVTLLRAGAVGTLAVTVSSGARAFALAAGAPARLAAGDPFLDAMTFSRGRLLVRADALPALVLPAYAEIGRVVEDCRG